MGPVSDQELREKVASGEIGRSDMVWKEGMGDWQPVSSMPDLLPVPTPTSPTEVEPTAATPPVSQPSPYGAPQAQGPMSQGTQVPNYLWQSIVVTILCCWPLGIPAIVYAAKVDGLVARGDINGAWQASASAKKWALAAFISSVALIAIWAIVVVGGAAVSQ